MGGVSAYGRGEAGRALTASCGGTLTCLLLPHGLWHQTTTVPAVSESPHQRVGVEHGLTGNVGLHSRDCWCRRDVRSGQVKSGRVRSCHVTSCHVMPRHVMSCHVMSCHVMSCHSMLGQGLKPCDVMLVVILALALWPILGAPSVHVGGLCWAFGPILGPSWAHVGGYVGPSCGLC